MFNSELDFQISKIEKNFFEKLYREKPDYINIDELSAVINNIFENVSGVLLDPLYENERSKFLYGILNKKNRNKIIPIKFQTTDIKNIKYFYKGNNCLLISLDGNSSKRIKVSLMLNKIFRLRVLNLTEELRGQGYDLIDWLRPFLFSYNDIHNDAKSYELAIGNNDEEKAIYYAKQCLGDCFRIRDFYNAKKWLERAVDLLEDKSEIRELTEVWNKVEDILRLTEEKIKEKSNNIIVLHWIDDLRYDHLHNLPFVESRMKEGIFYEKMYTVTPNTRPTAIAMLAQKTIIDDDGRKINDADILNSRLGVMLQNNDFKFCSNSGYLLQEFNVGNPFWGFYKNGAAPSTLIMYYAVCRMECGQKSFMLNHYLYENHPPCISPRYPKGADVSWTGEFNKYALDSKIAGQQYIDEQCRYYDRFFGKAKINIYMSDHGHHLFEKDFSPNDSHHVVFSIVHKDVKLRRTIKKAESLLNFTNILESVIEDQEITERTTPGYAIIQQDDAYGKNLGADVFRGDLWNFLQYRGVITSDDSYVRFVDGQEYYLVGDDKTNRIKDENNRERVQELRKLAGNEYIDIYKDPFYVKTRKFYKEHNIKRAADILYKKYPL